MVGTRGEVTSEAASRPAGGEPCVIPAEEYRRLQTLVQVGYAINSSLEVDAVLDLVLEHGMHALDAEAGTFWLLDGERLTPRAVRGPRAEAMRQAHLRSGEGLVGQTVVLRSGLLVHDVRRYPLWASHVDAATGYRTRTLLCVPLEAGHQVLGALQFVNKRQRRRFDNEDLQLAMALARQAALALANSLLFEQTQRVHEGLIRSLIAAVEAWDPCTAGHSQRVSQLCAVLADHVGLVREARRQAEWAGLLHDVGKLGILPLLLRKHGRLNARETRQVREHARLGADMIARLNAGLMLQPVGDAVRHHHERFDGTGYPDGLRNQAIPLLARIVAIADAYDAMTSDRPYHTAEPAEIALHEIEAESGRQFDPDLARAFIAAGRAGRLALEPLPMPPAVTRTPAAAHSAP